jgi:hypothetical protein
VESLIEDGSTMSPILCEMVYLGAVEVVVGFVLWFFLEVE